MLRTQYKQITGLGSKAAAVCQRVKSIEYGIERVEEGKMWKKETEDTVRQKDRGG